MLKGITLTDRIKVPTQRKFTDSGQMIVPCAFARTGSQVYSAGALGLTDVKPDTPVTVLRDEADVFDDESMTSFRSVPVTIGHPKEDGKNISVTADNADKLQVGVLEGVPTRDENKLTGTLVIARQDAIDMIEEGTQELSAGYTCDVEVVDVDGEKTYHQRNIRANHIAIVDKGRAGSHVRIADDAEPLLDDEIKPSLVADETSVASKTECKDITPEKVVVAVADTIVDPISVEDATVVIAKELKVGDEGYDIYSALQALNDEIKAVNWYVEAINYCEDEALIKVFKYALEEEQDHCVMLLDWLATQNTTDENAVTMDEAELLVVDARSKKDVVVTDELETANSTIAKLTDELDAGVEARVEVILTAKDLTDIEDFSGKSVDEIRKLVVVDVMPTLDLTDKDEAYINARFDIIVEDSLSGETSMSKVLRKSAKVVVVDTKPVDPVADARQKMIDRQTSNS